MNELVMSYIAESCNSKKWLPNNLIHCITWFQDRLKEIPLDYQESATIDFYKIDDPNDAYLLCVEIHYERPETVEETQARLSNEQLAFETDMKILKAIKEKYNLY